MEGFMLSPVRQWAQQCPLQLALRTPERDYTWAELSDVVSETASTLAQQGVGQGDVLTCIGKNNSELLFVLLACMELGAICAISMPGSEQERAQKLSTLYPASNAVKLWSSRQDIRSTLSLDFSANERQRQENFSHSYHPDNLATLIFTSGSTGPAKAVAHTHAQHLASATGLLAHFSFQPEDCWLLSLPLYHVSGMAIVYRWLVSGAQLKIGTGELAQDIQQVTHASLVATQLKRLLDSSQPLQLSRVLLGGSHIPLELSQQAADRGIDTWLGYGLTEAASTVTAKRVDGKESAGVVLPHRRVMVHDGRILIGGETLASGYYFQGQLTPLPTVSVPGQGDGFDSKDLGHWQDNELCILGRADNLFISGGENVHCEEIEAALCTHSAIRQAIVVPIDDAEYGQRPIAVIDANALPDKTELDSHLTPLLAKFKWPIGYYLMPPELTQTGIKVSRYEVKKFVVSSS